MPSRGPIRKQLLTFSRLCSSTMRRISASVCAGRLWSDHETSPFAPPRLSLQKRFPYREGLTSCKDKGTCTPRLWEALALLQAWSSLVLVSGVSIVVMTFARTVSRTRLSMIWNQTLKYAWVGVPLTSQMEDASPSGYDEISIRLGLHLPAAPRRH